MKFAIFLSVRVVLACFATCVNPVAEAESALRSKGRRIEVNASDNSLLWLQYDALYQIYNATNMDADQSLPFHNWHFNDTVEMQWPSFVYCEFTGVTCDDVGNITSLKLDDSGLSGSLPEAIGELSYLQHLNLNNNSIGSTLPETLLQIPDLAQINIARNFFTGPIPDFSQLSSLNRAILNRNSFSGTLPASLCKLTSLRALDVSYVTRLEGFIPECFGALSSLISFKLTGAGLGGSIPSELCSERDMNGFSPNTYGCDAIACSAGTFHPNSVRMIDRWMDGSFLTESLSFQPSHNSPSTCREDERVVSHALPALCHQTC